MSDSYNYVFKQSLNAFHNELISGGSSGGEGALVGARGSIIGIGTDIGGELRPSDDASLLMQSQAPSEYQRIYKGCTVSVQRLVAFHGRKPG